MTPLAFCRMFAEGFRAMTLGRTLWLLVALKLAVLFGVIKPLFFHNELDARAPTPAAKSAFVAMSLAERAPAEAGR